MNKIEKFFIKNGNYVAIFEGEEVKVHVLKIKKEYYYAIKDRFKKFEIRKNDRNFQVGDLIRFFIIDENNNDYLSISYYQITYLLKDIPEYGLKKGYCVFSIKEI